ncbi:hypothetical protein [Natronorubrum sulfidifaciens]|uniref:Uncharacterized protein n=1 Tax=Natronorubrum sulfidifaciens JCM 14089 TaxID=1230460 RepID=L9W5P4_9EURY|nr:hypothetical protein [Natronorubrum sulfidifaciens]ELY44677.1 hypothetical protein C495_09854 [Natronorubrum sulfidifaciens JCM 14089]
MVESGAVVSILAGGVTALFAVFLTFYLRNQWQEIQSLRAIQAELEQNTERVRELADLLTGDVQRQQVDLPIEVPPGTKFEIRYVVSFPSALSTTAFEQLKHSGMVLRLSPEVRQSLFELYDTIDRINRLRQHRERVQFDDIGNVHIVIDPSNLDIDPNTSVTEADLPAETRQQLADLRRMRRAMKGVNTSILRLIASISSPALLDDLELDEFVDTGYGSDPHRGGRADTEQFEGPNLERMETVLCDLERASIWSRFM